ncbi:MAG: class I SAM-dependent methyltransferase [Candidatus Cloacimonetes bacterium]|nr:class I SAM-dependent methyltransferase [Candidatus Cloacimonadota bacterium]
MNWDDFAPYYDWEFELICTKQKEDVELWTAMAERFGAPILDLCCGSGRITTALALRGYNITAVDNSPEMLNILKNKQLKKVKTIVADIKDFNLKNQFQLAIISYSSFQQLLTLNDQIACLDNISKHLIEGGILAMDINPRICEGDDILKKTPVFTGDYPLNNSTVTMFTSHKIDRVNQIKHWQDEYLEITKSGEEKRTNIYTSLKECSLDLMQLLFDKCNFEIINIYGDFKQGKLTADSENIIYVARKKR